MSKIEELKRVEDGIRDIGGALADMRRAEGYLPVPGEGSLDAKIMLVGEAPGKNEALTGKPFCGKAGKILDELLQSVGIPRDEVYITSIVKDRPPKNRDPLPGEIALYTPFLDKQIEIIEPKIIATLGRFAMVYVMERFGLGSEVKSISELHGKAFETPDFKLVPLFHPAAAIYSQKLKPTLIEDFKVLKTLI
jgi:uracil-DNA glycosylase